MGLSGRDQGLSCGVTEIETASTIPDSEGNVIPKLQASVNSILPPTTAVTAYTISLQKLSAHSQFVALMVIA